MGIIKGKKLMVFISTDNGTTYQSIAYATSHSFKTSASTISVSTKDDGDFENGRWENPELDVYSWSLTTENLFSLSGQGHSFSDIMDIYLTGRPVMLKFDIGDDVKPSEAGWESSDNVLISGTALITSLDVNAPNGDNASYTAEFTGKGTLNQG